MSRSGVGLAPSCISTYEELKLGKAPKPKYIIYKLSDDKKNIEVETTSQEMDYKQFLDKLPDGDCRYAIYDFDYELPGGEGKRNKIIFLTWSPDEAPIRSKMIYSSSKDALRRALTGIGDDIQVSDKEDIKHGAVLERYSKIKST